MEEQRPKKLLDQVREANRLNHHSYLLTVEVVDRLGAIGRRRALQSSASARTITKKLWTSAQSLTY